MTIQCAMTRYYLCFCLLTFTGCGDDKAPTAPTPAVPSIAGTWVVAFRGTVVQLTAGGTLGTPQHDNYVYALQQSGTVITGQMIIGEGRSSEIRLPLSGTLTANRFEYRVDMAGGCPVTIRADTTLSADATAFAGNQSQSTCEGRAEGQVNGTKR
jgi:hypothetical protein